MGGVLLWWACLCLFGAVQAQTDDGTYKLANFQENDVPKVHDASLEKIKTFSGSLWDAAWKDYKATQARLDAEKDNQYSKWGGKLVSIVTEMRKSLTNLKSLDADRATVQQQFNQQKTYWEEDAAEQSRVREKVQHTYEAGFSDDLKAQHQSFFRVENRGKKKLDSMLDDVNRIKAMSKRQGEALMRRVGHQELYYKGRIEDLSKETGDYVGKTIDYDKKRQERALRMEHKRLADALALQSRVTDIVKTIHEELDEAADKVVKVVKSRDELVNNADSTSTKTEADGVVNLETAMESSAKKVVDRFDVALEKEESSVESIEQEMEQKMRKIKENTERQFSSIALDLDATDDTLERGLVKVDGAAVQVEDAQKALALGKAHVGKVFQKYEEGVNTDKDTAKGVFDSAVKQLKTDLNMRIALQEQQSHTVGLKRLNEENQVFGEAMDQLNKNEDARKEVVTTEIEAANIKGAEVSNKTLDYATFIDDLAQNTTNARGTIDSMKAGMLDAMTKDDEALEYEIALRSHEIEKAAEKIPKEVGSVGAVTDQAIKGMGTLLKTKWLKDIPAAKINADIKIAPVDTALEDWKRSVSSWMRRNLDKIQRTVENTGKLINQVMPALKNSARRSADGVLRDVQRIEDELNAGSKAAYVKVAEDEHVFSQLFRNEAEKTQAKFMEGLGKNDRAVTKWARELAVRIAARKAELKNGEDNLVRDFSQSVHASRDISSSIQHSIIKLKVEIMTLKERLLKLSGPEKDQEEDLRKAIADAVAILNKALDLQENQAKATMEKYSADVIGGAEERQHKVAKSSFEASAAATKALMSVEDRYADLFEKGFEDIRVLSVRMQGLPANESEWSQGLAAKIRATAGVAKEFEALLGKSKLEQQAVIDGKFRAIGELLEQKVHGLADSKRAVLAKLTQRAKQEMERAVHQGKLTGKQLAERMKGLMGWLEGQVSLSEENVGESLDSANNTQEFWNRVEENAESRADSLMALVGREDAAANVRHDRDIFEDTHNSMEVLLSDLEQTVNREKAAASGLVADLETAHEFHATQMKSKYSRDASAMAAQMAAEEDRQTDQLKRTQKMLERHDTMTQDMAKAMDESVNQFDTQAFRRLEVLTDHSIEREKIQNRVKAFVDTLQVLSAETLYNAADVMAGLLSSSKAQLGAQAGDIAGMAKQLELAMDSEHFQLLQGFGRIDRRLDAMSERNDERAMEQKVVERTMSTWRTDVAQAVDAFGGSLGKELEALRQQGLGFEQRVKADVAGLNKQQKSAVDAIGNEVDTMITEDQQKLSDHQHEFDESGTHGQLGGGQNMHVNTHEDNAERTSMQQEQKYLAKKATETENENVAIDEQQSQYQAQQMEKAVAERSDLRDNLNVLANGVSASSTSLTQIVEHASASVATEGPPSDDVRTAVFVSAELLAQHSLLEERLRALLGKTTEKPHEQ